MKCPECNTTTRVINTRAQPGGVRRQHRCLNCGYSGYSAEVWMHVTYDAAAVKAAKLNRVETRRANEDRRAKDAS